jgi:hypothetical protein
MQVITKLRKFFLLPLAEKRLFMVAGFLLTIIRLGLFLLPFPNLMKYVARLSRTGSLVPQADPCLREKIAWAVRSTAPYVPMATCLTQALVAQIMLKSRRFPADLFIGVTKDDIGRFQAHAWIVSSGQVIIGSEGQESFVPFGKIS